MTRLGLAGLLVGDSPCAGSASSAQCPQAFTALLILVFPLFLFNSSPPAHTFNIITGLPRFFLSHPHHWYRTFMCHFCLLYFNLYIIPLSHVASFFTWSLHSSSRSIPLSLSSTYSCSSLVLPLPCTPNTSLISLLLLGCFRQRGRRTPRVKKATKRTR